MGAVVVVEKERFAGVKEIYIPPRRVIKEGRHYKIYIPKAIVEMYDLTKPGRKVQIILRIKDAAEARKN